MSSSHYHGNVGNFYNFVKIRNPEDQPLDTVQEICIDPFNSAEHGFLSGGWDGILRYGRIKKGSSEEIEIPFKIFLEHPIISVTIGKNNIAFAGLSTGDIVAVDLSNSQCQQIGVHEGTPVCKLFWIDNYSLLMSLGFDQKLKFWNLSNNNGNFLAQEFNLPFKTHTAAFDYPFLVVGTAEGKVGLMNMNTLPNLKIPPQNGWYDIMEFGSKFTCATIKSQAKLFALGCADGRSFLNTFKENYNGIEILSESSKKMYSKSQKKQNGYNHSPPYGQVNDIEIAFEKNNEFLVITGTQEISFFNLVRKDKCKRIKLRGTSGKVTLDGNYFIFAEGNDWLEGMHEWKKLSKPKIEAVKFSRSELEDLIKPKQR